MKLINLQLKNYRNCKDINLNLKSNKILIIGKNAQGKTNILESIYMLATLKSPRTYNNEKKRELKVNRIKTTPKNFKTALKTVLFSTADLLLLRGAPSNRRDWLDRAISQIYPAYDERLSKYDKIRIQKNNCLKNYLKTGNLNETLLDVYNEQLVITGSNIIFLRIKFLKEIEKLAKEKHRSISSTEELNIKYECSFLDGQTNLDDIVKSFSKNLKEKKDEELRRGQSCTGPHRDDIQFYINNNDAAKFASQGQQRTVVLALKLSELDIITAKTGEEPLLLLDDVLAELDDLRQNYLLKSINTNTQTIITSVDTLLFEDEFLKDVTIYNIEKGKIM